MKTLKIIKNISLIISFALIFSIFVIGEVFAKTYYMATNVSDSNPGTLSQPWARFNYAFSQMSGGDTLYVKGGGL